MRFTWDEAIKRGLVSREDAKKANVPISAPRLPQDGFTPQERLWHAIEEKWPGRATWELARAIPGRRFRIDIAFKAEKLAIEVDGLRDHTSIKGYRRDREKDILLVRLGWRVMRFTPGMIINRMEWVIKSIAEVMIIASGLPRPRHLR